MSDLSFNRKYRPKNLRDFVGNEDIKKSVSNILKSEKRPQAILISGPAGTGKTSMARLLAKEYLCENRDEEKGACDECYTCKAMNTFIESGDSSVLDNITEVDITDSNKKQDIEDILVDASTPSFDGNWKVYILDECHMMTPSAQNRLLKTMEEPPEKVLLILCTTNPEKILNTIKSRCIYDFKMQKPSVNELKSLLKYVCNAEKITYYNPGADLICQKSNFVPREALINLENVWREKHDVSESSVREVLKIQSKNYKEFFSILLEEPIDISKYLAYLGNMKMAMHVENFIDGIIPYIMRGIYISYGVLVEGTNNSEIKEYQEIFKKFKVDDLVYLLETLLNIQEQSSERMEAFLLILGYKGLHKPVETVVRSSALDITLDNTQFSATEEKKKGEEAYQKSITVTEEDKQKTIKKLGTELNSEQICTEIGATQIRLDQNSKAYENLFSDDFEEDESEEEEIIKKLEEKNGVVPTQKLIASAFGDLDFSSLLKQAEEKQTVEENSADEEDFSDMDSGSSSGIEYYDDDDDFSDMVD